MLRWRIYYDDGTTHDSSTPEPTGNERGVGVLVIVQADDAPGDPYAVGRELLFDADFYCWRARDARWFRCDLYGLFDYLASPGLMKKVLAGRMVERDVYKSTLIAAQGDPDFPPKSAVQAGEERLSL